MLLTNLVRKIFIGLFIFLCIGVGLYPLMYALVDMQEGLLGTKPSDLLANGLWRTAFNTHIAAGGLALLIGWSQFRTGLRQRYVVVHRWIGRVYVFAVLLSGSAALGISPHATAGPIASFGFGALAVLWLFTTWRAYTSIRHRRIEAHRRWMVRSYALTFAAVTLRLWLPLMNFGLGLEFNTAYRIVAWLCWVPNLLLAEWWLAHKPSSLDIAESPDA